ncbi:MAG: hypothetical protein ACJ73L_02605 [Actinomycetes bacterium]
MASRDDFSEEEWNTLHRGLTGAGMWVAVSERGFTSTFRETGAMASFLAHQSTEASSQLCRELAGTKGSGWKVSSSPEEIRQGTLAALRAAKALLTSKDAEDLTDYRELVLALANRVSGAAQGGDDVEAGVITEIAAALDQ